MTKQKKGNPEMRARVPGEKQEKATTLQKDKAFQAWEAASELKKLLDQQGDIQPGRIPELVTRLYQPAMGALRDRLVQQGFTDEEISGADNAAKLGSQRGKNGRLLRRGRTKRS